MKKPTRLCSVCSREIYTEQERPIGDRNRLIGSKEGIYFRLINKWFCNSCWKKINKKKSLKGKEI